MKPMTPIKITPKSTPNTSPRMSPRLLLSVGKFLKVADTGLERPLSPSLSSNARSTNQYVVVSPAAKNTSEHTIFINVRVLNCVKCACKNKTTDICLKL